MAGTYDESLRPKLPGAYTRYTSRRPATLPPAPGVTVAVPVVHDWGPMDEPILLGSFQEWQEDFGDSDTDGSRAIYDAFRGEGLEGRGGAGGVLALRFGASSSAKAAVTVDDPAAADAITFTAKYEGTKGNDLRILRGPIVNSQQEVSIMLGTAEMESYIFTINATGARAGLVAAINANSDWVVAELEAEGTTGLGAGTSPLVGGDNGATVTAGDWAAGFTGFANDDFAFLAPFNIPWASGSTEPAPTNRSIIDALLDWAQAEHDRGHRFTTIIGGVLDETVTDAVARAASANSELVITIGGPGVNDDEWGPRSTAQLVPRIAGIYAQRGETQAAHFARLAGTTPRSKPAGGGAITLADAETLTNGGVVAIMRDRYREAPTRLVKSVNTYTGDTDEKSRDVFSNPKNVLSMQQFANEVEAEVERELIGAGPVNQAMREAAAQRALRRARNREGSGAFNPGTLIVPRPGGPTDEHIDLDVTLVFGRALAQLFINANVQ